MRTAILSVFLAIFNIAAQQDPIKPTTEQTQPQQKATDPPLTVLCAPGTTIQLGVPYSSPVIASGGTGAYQFSVAGGSLPGGIALNPATGIIGGTPSIGGAFSYTVQVTDSGGAIATTGNTPCTLQSPTTPAVPTVVPATEAATSGGPPKVPVDSASGAKPPVIAPPEIDPVKLAQPREKSPESAASQANPDEHPFILGAEDQISVQVYGSPEFSGNHMIRPDGVITMPFLGDVKASGFAPTELSAAIRDRLRKFIVDPDVSVQVTTVNSKKFYIQGEVGKTGGFPLLVPTRVLEALVNAGGFRDFANQKKIVIMRVTGERLHFNYKEVIAGKKMEQNVFLKPGDIIIVK
ncbi:MAG: polysaccharide biosynthesis/export family protein [Candidatus Solibacter sp.]